MARILLIEPFYGGSHKYFADGLKKHSRHEINLLTLPARFWKWRMRGAAVYLSQSSVDFSQYDAIITSNMLSLSDFKALSGPDLPPTTVYFHENQILYPLADGEKEDLHYGFTDYTTALCADALIFNSTFHRDAFIDSIPEFLSRFPDFRPADSSDTIRQKSQVMPPGCQLDELEQISIEKSETPVILWNHRWEHDKNPEEFFDVLFELARDDIPFRIAILGEQFSNSPEIFQIAKEKLKDRIMHFGYAEDYRKYRHLLSQSHIVLSTAYQENFGISIVEAIGSGSFPLLPDRLSYREIIPRAYHNLCIYKNRNDLLKKLKKLIEFYDPLLVKKLAEENYRYSWKKVIQDYDQHFDLYKKNPG